ncbi:MAG: DNA (cytosine-5-)-methyltransferase [Chlamydiae bacterium RIFCSPHIGHO2_12_FULL_27_8]|nr:MAG: DNA (cytosine-5-)-methyltransferase [Chlamydiae bacterium RIFCSPHIGHO2_12_FULL_27_8]
MAYKNEQNESFTFIDLFAGIGGFHIAFHQLGGECVYASEWDENARKTYEYNFKKNSPNIFQNDLFRGDITLEENQKSIPEDVDILCAGFPCQPFSQAGFKKGFSEIRGTLFFEIAKIIREKQPKTIFLENVRHLLNHDNGKTFEVIRNILENELHYSIFYKIMKASDYGLPTHRPRIYIIGFRKDLNINSFEFPAPIPLKITMKEIFQGECAKEIGYTLRVGGRGSGLHDRRNWDTYLVNGKIHRITSNEAKLMMGFPDDFFFPVSEAQALKQLGNSVAVDPIRMTTEAILNVINESKRNNYAIECQ